MKFFILLSCIFLLSASADKCSTKKAIPGEYKARLEIKALCMNYTFTLQEGNMDTSLINASWTDETTGKIYKNAFGFVNPCDFPSSIKEGDEFWFVIDSTRGKECAVCLAYYPTPPKKLWMRVINK